MFCALCFRPAGPFLKAYNVLMEGVETQGSGQTPRIQKGSLMLKREEKLGGPGAGEREL